MIHLHNRRNSSCSYLNLSLSPIVVPFLYPSTSAHPVSSSWIYWSYLFTIPPHSLLSFCLFSPHLYPINHSYPISLCTIPSHIFPFVFFCSSFCPTTVSSSLHPMSVFSYPPLFLFILLYCIALCQWLDTSHALCYLEIKLRKEVNEDSFYTKHFLDCIHNTYYSPSLIFQSPLQHSKAGIFHRSHPTQVFDIRLQDILLFKENYCPRLIVDFFSPPSRCLKPSSGFWKTSQIPAPSLAFQLYRWLSRPLRRLKKKHRLRLKLQARWATCNI